MFSNKLKCCAILFAGLGLLSCGNKEIPQGTRITVLPMQNDELKIVTTKNSAIRLPAATTNHNWSQSGGNSEHLRGNLSINFPLKQIWKQRFGKAAGKRDIVLSEPVVYNNIVYTLDANTAISAFSLTDGKQLWQKKLLSKDKSRRKISLKAIGLAVSNNKIVATTGFGEVFALDTKNGSQIWHFDAKTPIRIAPTITSERVFVQTIDNKLFALNLSDGEKVWDYEVLQEDTTLLGGASPAFDIRYDILVAAFSNGELQAFKASTGSPLWSTILVSNRYAATSSPINAVKSNPVISGDLVFAAGNNKVFAAIDAKTGEKVWELPISANTQPVVSGNYMFVISEENVLYAIEKENGTVLWKTKLNPSDDPKETAVALNPLLLDGKVVTTFTNGTVIQVEATSGEIIKKSSLEEAVYVAPIVVEKKLIFTTAGAELIVFE